MYSIVEDETEITQFIQKHAAIAAMVNIHAAWENDGKESTMTVVDETGVIYASRSNKKIVGNLTKQAWGGKKGDDAMNVGEIDFDATITVLLLPYEKLLELKDNHQTSDNLGNSIIDWNGPHFVTIENSICEYFGVDDIKNITKENYDFVKSHVNPTLEEPISETVELRIKVNIHAMPKADIQDFLDNLDCSIVSNTQGITIKKTEIIESEIKKMNAIKNRM